MGDSMKNLFNIQNEFNIKILALHYLIELKCHHSKILMKGEMLKMKH